MSELFKETTRQVAEALAILFFFVCAREATKAKKAKQFDILWLWWGLVGALLAYVFVRVLGPIITIVIFSFLPVDGGVSRDTFIACAIIGSLGGGAVAWLAFRKILRKALGGTILEDDKYQTFWRRFWASWIDIFAFYPIGWINAWGFTHISAVPLLLLWYIPYSCAFVGYSIFMHTMYGQTIGKMICGVVVRDVSEAPLSFRQAMLRDILPLVLLPISIALDVPDLLQRLNPARPERFTPDSLRVLGYISLLWGAAEVLTMLTNKKRRSVHDLIAGSVVIRKGGVSVSKSVSVLRGRRIPWCGLCDSPFSSATEALQHICTKHEMRESEAKGNIKWRLDVSERCPFCGESVQTDVTVCKNCEKDLPPDEATILPEKVKCPNCKTFLTLSDRERLARRFSCPACSSPFDGSSRKLLPLEEQCPKCRNNWTLDLTERIQETFSCPKCNSVIIGTA